MTDKPPPIVWHYTTPEGLMGILSNRCLWASHAAFLNDPLELRIANERTKEIWRKIVDEIPDLGPMLAHYSRTEGLTDGDHYLTSFSEKGDSLSQWRAYAGHGRGFAIGFDLRPEHWRYDHRKFSISKCIYGHKALEAALQSERERLSASFGPGWKDDPEAFAQRHGHQMVPIWLRILSRYKDAAYNSEAEWRLLGNNQNARSTVSLRASSLGLTPYLEVPFEPSAIRAIRVGPALPVDHAQTALGLLLEKAELRVEIATSAVAYRP